MCSYVDASASTFTVYGTDLSNAVMVVVAVRHASMLRLGGGVRRVGILLLTPLLRSVCCYRTKTHRGMLRTTSTYN